ncbi:hypothetical protein P4W15_09165 [Morganella morganii]|nr:hypothetical protein [Morganella morganii]
MLNYDYRFSRDSNSFSQRTGHTLLLQSGVNAGGLAVAASQQGGTP